MFIYILILTCLFLLGLFESHGALNKTNHRLSFLLVILFFWILSFVRWETGTDWDPYYLYFQSNETIDDFSKTQFEPFYLYINYIVKSFTDYYWFLLLVIGGLIYSLTAPTIYKYSPFPFVSLVVYLMLRKADIFFVRESIALACCLFSLRYMINKKFLKFILCIIVGMQFHRSVVIFIPAYFIFSLNLNYKKVLLYLGLFSFLVVLLQNTILQSILQVAGGLGDVFLDKAEHYSEEDANYGGGGAVIRTALPKGLLNRSILLAMMLYSYSKNRSNAILVGLINIYMASIFIYILTMPISVVLSRVSNSYDIFCIPALGYFIQSISKKNRPIVFILFFLYMAVRFVFGTLLGNYSASMVPYKTIFG